ncbi:MAG TPA: nitrate- and nitrite sensing domain-containing protein, partial [Ramlibacter sp.]
MLGRLAIWQKLAIFGFLGVAVSLPPTVMYVAASSADVDRIQREAAGLEPAQALLQVIRLLQQHRGLSAGVLGGNADMASRREQVQGEVDQAMSQATAVFGRRIGDRATGERWKQAVEEWRSLSRDVSQKSISGSKSFAAHTALVATCLTLVDRIADEFGLSRDPSADTSVLIDAVFTHLPNLTESLGQARAVGTRLLAQGEVSPEERAAVATLGGVSRLHLSNLSQALNEAGELNPRLRTALAAPLKQGAEAVENALRVADDEVIRAERLSFQGTEYFRVATVAIDAMFALNSMAATELTGIMLAREAAVRNFQALMFGLIGVIALLAVATGYGVTRAITTAMGEAVRLAREVAAGDLRSDVRVTGRDEIAQLMGALKEMNGSLGRIVGQVRASTDAVTTASGQLAAGNQDLSQRTEEQAASLEETAASMEELTGTVKQNAENAQQANQLAHSAS